VGRKPKIIPPIDGEFDDIVKSLFSKDEEIRRKYKKKTSEEKSQDIKFGYVTNFDLSKKKK